MKRLLPLGLAALLVVASLATGTVLQWGAGGWEEIGRDRSAHDHATHSHPSRSEADEKAAPRSHFREREPGRIPPREEALTFERAFSTLTIHGRSSFSKFGWIPGSGTRDDPYILERIFVERILDLANSDAYLVVRNSYVQGKLRLNYLGENVYVHHIHIGDLRINENVKRSGANTGGLIEENEIGLIGQMRHFTGEFRLNQVGPRPEGLVERFLGDSGEQDLPAGVVWNFDGFHGAAVHHNRVEGFVDIKLHGHNHASCFACEIHYHGQRLAAGDGHDHEHDHAARSDGQGGASAVDDHAGCDETCPVGGHRVDHTDRFHSLDFSENTIVSDGIALRYNDRNHAGDDRQATSEREATLELPHVHHQRIVFERNVLRGAFFLDIFYAKDDLHDAPGDGTVIVRDNDITVPYARSGVLGNDDERRGIVASAARFLELEISGNRIRFEEERSGDPIGFARSAPVLVGILLSGFARSAILVTDNVVESGDVGLRARSLGETVTWRVAGNDFRTDEEIDADGSVKSKPDRA